MIYTDYLESRKNKNKKLTYNLQIPNVYTIILKVIHFMISNILDMDFQHSYHEDTHVFSKMIPFFRHARISSSMSFPVRILVSYNMA
jgi:hypothetical protein